ncbi:serine/threonine-protein kinase [Catenulispora subtropica]|uniref:serine/threonine-protein kinase n=1 Tax=Catenulispora subtropica TaxID=450798 RepID=UPI0031DF2A36
MGESGGWAAPGYTEIRELGSGATGRVVLARHDASGRLVALKYLAPRLVGSAAFAERFQREAALMALVRDPNVVEVYDLAVDPAGRGVALVMEAVEGPTLRALLGRGHGSPEAALSLLRGSLLGLAAAHDKGVVHRDYKPDNVLVDASGRSKLTDFGIATTAWEGVPAEGTPPYMAPEQWNGYPAAPASDMYSAAVVFYECVTGVRPFRSETLAELRTLHETAPPPLDRVPPPVRGFLERGLAKYPEQRYGDVRSFLADVEASAVAGYGPDWLERGVRDLAYVAAGMIAALPLLALAAGTTAAGTVGFAGTAGAAGAAGAAGTAGAGTGAAGMAGTGAVGTGAVGTGAAGTSAVGTSAASTSAAGLGHGAVQAGTHGTTAAAQAFGHSATHTAGHSLGQAAVHGSSSAGQFIGDGATHGHQAIQHTRQAAKWSRRGAKLLHGKALAATVATVTVVGATTTVAVVASGSSDTPQVSVAKAMESALHDYGSGNNTAICNDMSSALLKVYGGKAGCASLMTSANGFLNSLGGSLADQRSAARAATVDASKVVVTGNTALVPASAVRWKTSSLKVAGQTIQLDIEDTTWVKEGGRWLIGIPKDMPSTLPTDLFPSGSIPSDLFPTNIPSDLISNLPSITLPSDLFSSG